MNIVSFDCKNLEYKNFLPKRLTYMEILSENSYKMQNIWMDVIKKKPGKWHE